MPRSLESVNVGTDDIWFAGYPAPYVFDKPDGKKVNQMVWGDYVGILDDDRGEWRHVRARGTDGWMRASDLQSERLLELNFVDVGQGDGCFIVTPGDEWLLVDAGVNDNMFHFLNYRYNVRKRGQVVRLKASVITHSDEDHYGGFAWLIAAGSYHLGTVFHNGIIERGRGRLGSERTVDGVRYLNDLKTDLAAAEDLVTDSRAVQGGQYARLLKDALSEGVVGDLRMLSSEDGFLEGFDDPSSLAIEVLAPVPVYAPDDVDERTPLLPWFGSPGLTKNGHSVILRLAYGRVRILLGGDLNSKAEHYLEQQYLDRGLAELQGEERAKALRDAREIFEAEVAKACHHGSADFTTDFLQSVNAIATVISSGDDEPHSHPRPDALGATGRYGRGERPLIFSTELARSTSDKIRDPEVLRQKFRDLVRARDEAADDLERQTNSEELEKVLLQIERDVAVYGMINVRTDGDKILIAQKLERPSSGKKWDVHLIEWVDGTFRYVSKH